ncbi:MAG: rhomboid family protein [Candidatus Abyssobacteria bacterium SURF_5]|uniref:Rhomboid family protein n=1 Tax=Abyssobacteria bacterium (strain SURF_5) TaxID=2093360 RepID=A0A3A4P8Q4_ABYX5|nr:MAG: rhomboid family protein [Candidatus Abyssubacteria bacterium SURF_5]
MHDLSRQRCFNHAWREAVAQCLECHRYYCRECATEHEDRMICAPCLAKITGKKKKRKARLASLSRTVLWCSSFLIIWIFFYLLGRGLIALPSSFHEGNIWRQSYWSELFDS